MSSRILELLEGLLEKGSFQIGQLMVHPSFELHHIEDRRGDPALTVYKGPDGARRLVLYDQEGAYRPLKTAPNLAKGWLLCAGNLENLRLALDTFYPAALGLWRAFLERRLVVVPWRETVNRQTGMYRIVGRITDEQSEALFASVCRGSPGCLRKILWGLEHQRPHQRTERQPEGLAGEAASGCVPLLCAEACNLLVAAGRPVVKASLAGEGQSAAALGEG